MKFYLLFLALVLLTACQTTSDDSANHHAELISKVDSVIKENKFNGVILMAKDTSILYNEAFGYSDLESRIPIDLNDQFVIGSISKQITAVLILREYEKGRIDLHDTINQYLTEIDQPWLNEVTIHQLLTHTHGIVSVTDSLAFKAGSEFQYSQLGYQLLAQCLEKVTNKTFEELSTELFSELGMNDSCHPDNREETALVKAYEVDESGALTFARNSLDNYAAAGSFISSATDLRIWNYKLQTGRIVKPETLALMSTNFATRIHPIFERIQYGYGLLFKEGEQNIQIGALGYAPGFASACYFYPEGKLNLVVLGNVAYALSDFKLTFKVHTELMELTKDYSRSNHLESATQ